MSKSVSLCVREDLIAPSVPLKQLATDINQCILSPATDISAEDAVAAYDFIIVNKAKVPKNAEGKRVLGENDPIRPDVCRIIFHIPLTNLKRREERTLMEDPQNSVAKDNPNNISTSTNFTVVQSHKKQAGKASSNVPIHTVELFDKADDKAFNGYVGNEESVQIIEEQLMGAIMRGDPMPMILLRGPSGVGKTEIARRIAKRLGRMFYYVSGAVLKTGDDMHMVVEDAVAQTGCLVLCLDEIQGAGEGAQTAILTAQKDIETAGGKDAIIILATNLSGKILGAVKNRCLEIRLREYSVEELMQIIEDTAKEAEVTLESGVSRFIAERCHGIARYAKNNMNHLITANAGSDKITLVQAKNFFELRGVDELGLKAEHRQYILQLAKLGQASITSLAAALGENDTSEIANATEPLLLKHGLINITSKGRVLTETGQRYAEAITSKEA